MKKSNVIHATDYKGRSILASEKRGCHKEILDKLDRVFDHMLKKHNKVFFMRFDAQFPNDFPQPSSKTFQSFMANFIKNRKRKDLDPCYLWKREQSKDGQPHFHSVILMDGNKTKKPDGHFKVAEDLWARKLKKPKEECSGLIDHCRPVRANKKNRKNGILIRRGDPDAQSALEESFRWSSYLAKDTSSKKKDNDQAKIKNNGRSFGASEVPSDHK